MKKILTKALSMLTFAAFLTPLSASADVVTISSGESTQYVQMGVSFDFTPAVSGDLVISVADNGSWASPQNGWTISDQQPYPWNDGQCMENTMWSNVGDDYVLKLSVTQGTTYYLYCGNSTFFDTYYDGNGFTFTLTPTGGGDGGGDVLADVTMESGVPTPLKNGQKGLVGIPSELNDPRGSIDIKIVANTTASLGTILFENDTWEGPVSATPTVVDGTQVFTYTQPVSYGPWFIKQTVADEVTFTLTYPQLDEVQELLFDVPNSLTANSMYSFIISERMTLQVEGPQALSESQWNRVIYRDPARQSQVNTNTVFQDTSGGTVTDNKTTVTYVLTPGTYYFYAPVTGNFTLSEYQGQKEGEPFDPEVKLTAPLEGVEVAPAFVVQFINQTLSEDYSTFEGITVTNPKGVKLPIRKFSIGPAVDGSTALDGLTIMINTIDGDEMCREMGSYVIFIPAKAVYNTDMQPNNEVTLTYSLKPTASGSYQYFYMNEDATTNLPAEDASYKLNSLDDLVLTFPYSLSYHVVESDLEPEVGTTPTEPEDPTSINVYVNGASVQAELVDDYTLVVPIDMTAGTNDVEVSVRFVDSLLISENNEVNAPWTLTFTLYGASAEAELTPESGTTFYADSEDKTVSVVWEGTISYNNEDGDFENAGIALLDEDEDEVALEYNENVYINEELTGIVFDFSDVAEGIYTLVVPTAAILVVNEVDGEESINLNVSVSASFIVSEENEPADDDDDDDDEGDTSGVTVVGADANGNFTVYDLNGVKVAEGKVDVVKGLKGIYIINGKKVVLK